jgi:hypothetical protein
MPITNQKDATVPTMLGDETQAILVLLGEMRSLFRDGDAFLKEMDLYIVPCGETHKPPARD